MHPIQERVRDRCTSDTMPAPVGSVPFVVLQSRSSYKIFTMRPRPSRQLTYMDQFRVLKETRARSISYALGFLWLATSKRRLLKAWQKRAGFSEMPGEFKEKKKYKDFPKERKNLNGVFVHPHDERKLLRVVRRVKLPY